MGQQKAKVIGGEVEEKPKKKDKYAAKKEEITEPVKVEEKTAEKKAKTRPPKIRSHRYQEAKSQVDSKKTYSKDEAVELVKKTSTVKFDASVEVHIVMEQKKKETETFRGLLSLPHGTGKELKVVILDEKKIEEIAATKKADFDIALSTPEMMPKVAKIAKILGPQGKMPNPKSGTVTENPQKTLEEIKKGKIEYKADSLGIIHLGIGKVSWDLKKLLENLQAILSVLPAHKIKLVYLASSMGPSVKVMI